VDTTLQSSTIHKHPAGFELEELDSSRNRVCGPACGTGVSTTVKDRCVTECGNGVVAVATAKGATAKPLTPKLLHFSGYDWTVRSAGSDRGGEPNFYDPENAWVDENGYLHLRMAVRMAVGPARKSF